MKIPHSIQPLVDDGLVDEVLRQLKSGKEASVFVVRSGDEIRCAKVYKDAKQRGFRTHAQYQEGRVVRNSRRSRAMAKSSRYGRKEAEEAWQNAEVDALYRLAAAGVRVPRPYGYFNGVLLMELVTGSDGLAAPRLNDVELTTELAEAYHQALIREVVRMLNAGLIHGDLSEYNILVDDSGPVIIDLPQAVNAAGNNNACRMLLRDVENLAAYFGRYLPEIRSTDYGREIWEIYEDGLLHPEVHLTGCCERNEEAADIESVLEEIEAARAENELRRQAAQDRASDTPR